MLHCKKERCIILPLEEFFTEEKNTVNKLALYGICVKPITEQFIGHLNDVSVQRGKVEDLLTQMQSFIADSLYSGVFNDKHYHLEEEVLRGLYLQIDRLIILLFAFLDRLVGGIDEVRIHRTGWLGNDLVIYV